MVFADAAFYINGNKINLNARNNTYGFLQLDPGLFVIGENIIAIEATSPCNNASCQQFIDFGLYDTGNRDAEDIVIGPAQPNFVVGPNGFERWMMYKAYFDNRQEQGIDRIHFYNKQVVVESSTVKNSTGFRRSPSLPQLHLDFDKSDFTPLQLLHNSKWKISEGVLSQLEKKGGELLIREKDDTHYRFEVPFRLKSDAARAGVYAFYQDRKNWLKIDIGKDNTWQTTTCIEGVSEIKTMKLPDKFAFLENNSLVTHYEHPWHVFTIYKNTNRFRVELDQFNLTLHGDIVSPFSGRGHVGLLASSDEVDFDAVQYTAGWDEYDENISGWQKKIGEWLVSGEGLAQIDPSVENATTFKGDPAWNYEFSTYFRNDRLPDKGRAGYYPLYVDEDNFVKASVDYATKAIVVEGKEEGRQTDKQFFPLQKKVLKHYTSSAHPSSVFQYDLSNESIISGIDILWFEGDYPYLEQTFDLPRIVRFYALQEGVWKLLDAELEGDLKFSCLNKYSFPPVKTTAIKMVLENHSGKFSRAFSTWFTEDVTAGYFLRCRREHNALHLLVNDTYLGALSGNWSKSKVGLFTSNQQVVFNGMLFYELPDIREK